MAELYKRIVDHLKGKQDPDASFQHFCQKGGFALLDMPSAGICDVLVFIQGIVIKSYVLDLHLPVQNVNDRTIMKASPRIATVNEFYSILEHTLKTVYMRAQKRHLPRFACF